VKNNAKIVNDFIRNGVSAKLTFEQVKTLYPEALPSATADVIRGVLKTFDTCFRDDITTSWI
jgi:hypothetical protein